MYTKRNVVSKHHGARSFTDTALWFSPQNSSKQIFATLSTRILFYRPDGSVRAQRPAHDPHATLPSENDTMAAMMSAPVTAMLRAPVTSRA